MLSFACPTCEYRLLSLPGRAGKTLPCPRCKSVVTIPNQTDSDSDSLFSEDLPYHDDSSSVLASVEAVPPGTPMEGPAEETPPPVQVATSTAPPPSTKRNAVMPSTVKVTAHTPAQATPGLLPTRQSHHAKGMVILDPPKPPEDVVAQLTTAISMRMNPPPDPPSDLKLSTGVWMMLSAIGMGLWVFAILHNVEWLKYVWFFGGVQLLIGVAWVFRRASYQDPLKGLVAILPPILIFQLVRRGGPDGYRPLRFVLTGLLLCAMTAIAIPVRTVVRQMMGWTEEVHQQERPVETNSGRLRTLVDRTATEPLVRELTRLATPSAIEQSTPTMKQETITDLRALLNDDRGEVKAMALKTLVAWAGMDARPDVLKMLNSVYSADRSAALEMLVQWKDEIAAENILPLLLKRDDWASAVTALKSIGSPAAETVCLRALKPGADTNQLRSILEVLETVGTAASIEPLTKFTESNAELFLREVARQKLAIIKERARLKKN